MRMSCFISLVLAAACCFAAEEQLSALKKVGGAHVGFGVPGHGPVVIRGKQAYVPPGEGDFTILDISAKDNPRVAGYIPSLAFSYRICFLDNLAYFQNSRGGTFYVDLSAPASTDESNGFVFFSPKQLEFDNKAQGGIVHIDEEKKLMVTVAGGCMKFFSLSNPLTPEQIGEAHLPGESASESIVPNTVLFPHPRAAVFQSGTPLKQNFIYGVDFSDPTEPELTLLLSVDTSETLSPGPDALEPASDLGGEAAEPLLALDEKKEGPKFSNVFLSCVSEERFALILSGEKIQEPRVARVYSSSGSDPKLIAELPVPSSCDKHLVSAFHGDIYYLLDGKGGPGQYSIAYDRPRAGAGVWYAANLKEAKPEFKKVFTEQDQTAYGYITIEGDLAYVNDYNFGVRIFDLSEPGAPKQTGSCPTAGEGSGVYVDDARKLAFQWVTFGGTIYSIDVSDPSNPKRLGWFHDGSWVQYKNANRSGYIDGKDGIIYCGKSRLQALDARDPANMVHSGFLLEPNSDSGCRVVVSGDVLYALADRRLSVLDVKDAASPSLLGAVDVPAGIQPISMTVRDGVVYSMASPSQLLIIDCGKAEEPRVAATLDLSEHKRGGDDFLAHIAVSSAGYGYISSRQARINTELLVLDIRDASEPKIVGWVESDSGCVWGWACFNSNMVIDDELDALFVCKYMQMERFDISEPTKPRFVSSLHIMTRGMDDFQWVTGPAIKGRLYVPTLRELSILEFD